MRAIIISRKNEGGYGGLSRFFAEFVTHYPKESIIISPKNFYNILKIPFKRIGVIYLCDATLLPLGVILKTILKKPLIVTAHGLDLTYPNPFYQFMLRKALKKVDAIILDSQPARKLLNRFNFPKDRIFVIHPGISTDHLSVIKKLKIPAIKNKLVLTTVGNLVSRKGHFWFIENVLKKLPNNFTYFIVGDGPERKNLKFKIRNLKLEKRVFLLGRLTHPQLSFVLKNTHIYISPNQATYKNFESFGIAAGEAAALGLPVVASNVDGIPGAIKHGKNGLLVNPDTASFIKTLIQLKTTKKRMLLGSKARVFTLKHHTWTKAIQKYLKIFQINTKYYPIDN